MANINDRNRDFQNTVNTRKVTPDEVAYRDGYIQGRESDPSIQDIRRLRYTNQAARSSGMTSGVLLGILLASLVGVASAAFFILSDRDDTDVTPVPEAIQSSPIPVPSPSVSPQQNTTVIERTVREVPTAPTRVEVNLPPSPAPAPAPSAVQSAPQPVTPNPVNSPVNTGPLNNPNNPNTGNNSTVNTAPNNTVQPQGSTVQPQGQVQPNNQPVNAD